MKKVLFILFALSAISLAKEYTVKNGDTFGNTEVYSKIGVLEEQIIFELTSGNNAQIPDSGVLLDHGNVRNGVRLGEQQSSDGFKGDEISYKLKITQVTMSPVTTGYIEYQLGDGNTFEGTDEVSQEVSLGGNLKSNISVKLSGNSNQISRGENGNPTLFYDVKSSLLVDEAINNTDRVYIPIDNGTILDSEKLTLTFQYKKNENSNY